ncbi:hypothetical protein Vadar_028466 [Vaccinium darrowii]|uniref:Uncharacterized protein n=1 Tax=Vaccinium darrowii TaxID=229202 RepID=A0ACB7YGI0_9ERIC|nr:hypothetical protein Vadar_028466 [Vaccinium darrowii]
MAMNIVRAHPAQLQAGPVQLAVDWEEHGILGPIRDQGDVVVTCQAIEGLYNLLNRGSMIQLSPKHLVDCVRPLATHVYRSYYDDPFQFAVDKGIRMGQALPYHPSKHPCVPQKLPVMKIRSWSTIPDYDEEALMRAVSIQPVAVAVKLARHLRIYQQGVYMGSDILDLHPLHRSPDHAILLTGYGNVEGIDCWKVRNSQGTDWGIAGTGFIARNSILPSSIPPLLTHGTIPEGPYGF